MKTGMSIPLDYLLDNSKTKNALIFKKNAGCYKDFLPTLKTMGINYIELRAIKLDTDKNLLQELINKLRKYNFAVSIHSFLPDDKTIDGRSYFSFLDDILLELPSYQNELVITVHTYRGINNSYTDALESSTKMLNTLGQYIDKNNLPVKIAFELNRGDKDNDPSVTYSGLLQLYSMISFTDNIGICWDLGHTYSNVSNEKILLEAPEKFVNKVIHTHIHGVSKQDETHQPLTMDNLPLTSFLTQLNASGYNGIYNLEINYHTMLMDNNSFWPSLKNSIQCLQRTQVTIAETLLLTQNITAQ